MTKSKSVERREAAMARDIPEDAKAEVEEQPPVDNDHVAPGATPFLDDKGKKAKKASFDVFNAGGTFIRTYSVEQHGEKAEDLANEYAGKINGKVV
jgi:hypothetical protein